MRVNSVAISGERVTTYCSSSLNFVARMGTGVVSMRITRVYTRKGDKGKTGLVDGSRVSKASPRVEAYGDIDELNSYLGLIRAEQSDPEIEEALRKIQNDLFIVGADLASPMSINVPRIEKPYV